MLQPRIQPVLEEMSLVSVIVWRHRGAPVYPCYSGTREKIAKIKNIWAIFPLLPAGDPAPPWRGQGLSTVIKGFIQSLEIQIYTLAHVPIGL